MADATCTAVVTTARDRCRRCYSCVRRCPAKAIRVRSGQAEVIAERCLACGRCIKVCSQDARVIRDNLPAVRALLAAGDTVAMLAPSFAAAYPDAPGRIIAALRRAGFAAVTEVAFGADLCARAYRELREREPDRLIVSTPCPAAVAFVRKYAVEVLPYLAPILSPMAAMGKALKTRLRPGCRTVFIGPCTAKMIEAEEAEVAPWVDAVLTFHEVDALLAEAGVDPRALVGEEFDPPRSYLGGIFPVHGGLVRAAQLPLDPISNVVADVAGPDAFSDMVGRLRERAIAGTMDELDARLFDVLFCSGCVSGPAMPGDGASPLVRKERIVRFMRGRARGDADQSRLIFEQLADLDLSRGFTADDRREPEPSEAEIQDVLAKTGKHSHADELNCRACGYASCREKAIAVIHGRAELEMCLPYLIDRLESMIQRLNQSHEQLTEAQAQLLRAERLASMGQLAAGIAHEVNNPLGTILIYSHLLADSVRGEGVIATDNLRGDVKMILDEATRCRTIVGGLLDFARQNKVNREPTQVRGLLDEATRIIAAQTQDERWRFEVACPDDVPEMSLDRSQMLQVLLNLVRNAVEAMPVGGTVRVAAAWRAKEGELRLTVRDTGPGIPPEAMKKLFSPFYTTKPVGHGTGLGLPICYGIVKMHRGQITARNNADGPGATFEITIPAVGEEKLHVG
jgi:two-component system, NtrC family, sensor kinase